MAKIGLVFVNVPENCEECQFNYDNQECRAIDELPDPIKPYGKHRPIGCPIKVYEVRGNEKDNEVNS